MVKLSDYLNYLYKEVIHARQRVDEQSIELAKAYSEDKYLKYFRVPRFTIPTVNFEIPIKIDELVAETKYNFKMDETLFIADVNKKIEEVNELKELNIEPISLEKLKRINFEIITKDLEKNDYRFVKGIDDVINKIEFPKELIKVKNKELVLADESEVFEKELRKILTESLKNRFKPVSANLKDIFFDPDTGKQADKDKVLLKLNVEMVEEGLRIVKLNDENGKEFEEIVFE